MPPWQAPHRVFRWRALPENLHWSYWESYATWLTGFGLLTVEAEFHYDWETSEGHTTGGVENVEIIPRLFALHRFEQLDEQLFEYLPAALATSSSVQPATG